MNIVAIDTASDVLSVALRSESGELETTAECGLRHSELLLPALDGLVRLAGVERCFGLVACMKGPGSFTGLRIGMATAKGLAAASGCPLVALPALEVYAFGYAFFDGVVVPVLDAKKGRLFCALFEAGRLRSDELDISPAELARLLRAERRVLFTGPGAHLALAARSAGAPTGRGGGAPAGNGGGHIGNGDPLAALPEGWRLDERHRAGRSREMLRLALERFQSAGGEPDDAGPVYLRPSEAEASNASKGAP